MNNIDVRVETITPEIAKTYLTRNVNNRKPSNKTVSIYAREMKMGKWQLTHQGLAFDENGDLLDGQHRLWAVVEADVPVQMVVSRNMSRSTFMFVDNGRRRQAHQLLPGDITHRSSVASAARYLLVIEGSAGVGSKINTIADSVYWTNAPTHEILECVERWPELEQAAQIASTVYSNSHITKAPHTAVIAQIMRTSHLDRLDEWVRGLEYGAGLQIGDPRLALRDKFLRSSSSRDHSISKTNTYALIVKAWNNFVLNKPLKVARMGRSEAIQVVEGFQVPKTLAK